MADARVTQTAIEALISVDASAQVTQTAIEVLVEIPVPVRVTQTVIEVLMQVAADEPDPVPPSGSTSIGLVWAEAYLPD